LGIGFAPAISRLTGGAVGQGALHPASDKDVINSMKVKRFFGIRDSFQNGDNHITGDTVHGRDDHAQR
jgi:hypothetical protein